MQWGYGVTTVPERFESQLPRTLKSLRDAGFPNPRLFIDGPCLPDNLMQEYPVTIRMDNIGVPGNWHLALLELMIRVPNAHKYAIFQDDLICCRNLREYLEKAECPKDGYLNLYTWPKNYKLAKGRMGFYKSDQCGKGAVALVFDRKIAEIIVSHPHMLKKHTSAQGAFKAVDGAIVSAARQAKIFEYVHNPSLVQHLGMQSTMRLTNGTRKAKQPQAPNFKGQAFDALRLLKRP